uniref:NADH-ubiquinone oxidoreductase chain 2 n=1 Tax=Physconelloides eurysema TaxID=135605 RepID=Q2FCB1_9NEOP|nr:NADH dehydrogenase subunit 2 [Physconelloides eurysema]
MSNLLFIFMISFSVLVCMSCSSWIVCWMMMEVPPFFLVPILFGTWSANSSMIGLKYFIVQSVGSSIFLFSFMWESFCFAGWEWMSSEKEFGVLVILSLMLKLGVFPFSGWMFHISENLSWKNFFLLSSIQEVIPLIMISKFGEGGKVITLFCCVGMTMLVIYCFSNFSIHWMMIISSMFNICWMMVASLMSKESLFMYMLVYFSMLLILFFFLDMLVSSNSLSSMSSFSLFKEGKVVFIFVSFMVMGMPPLGSFLGKVEVIRDLVMTGMEWVTIYILLVSSIYMYLFLKISLFSSLSIKKSWTKGSEKNIWLIGVMIFFSISFLLFSVF